MPYTCSFDPTAANEYEEALNWYQERSVMAADNLLIAVEEAIEAISIDPYRYRNIYKNLRELSLKKYPYLVIYFVDEQNEHITITSLFHTKRNPKKRYNK